MIIPKKEIQKKYIIWGTNYGSNDSIFVVPGETKETEVPKGVAHFLEHKMFEQENGKNSLDVLTALGVNANAYTTNNLTKTFLKYLLYHYILLYIHHISSFLFSRTLAH